MLMRTIVCSLLIVGLFVGSALAASYQRNYGPDVDPILDIYGSVHEYLGFDLLPGELLDYVDLSEADLTDANLQAAQLEYANLDGAHLDYANLDDANLAYADLKFARLYHTYLSRANLNFADFTHANLKRADLSDANLMHAELVTADLRRADLTGANLSYADLWYANLSRANLTGATWLGDAYGEAFYHAETNFTNAWADHGTIPFDPVAAGWTLIPEPSSGALCLLALALLANRRRRSC